MTRDEATNIQYRASVDKTSAIAIYKGKQVMLYTLNYPSQKPQMAMIIHGDMMTGESEWVPLDELFPVEAIANEND